MPPVFWLRQKQMHAKQHLRRRWIEFEEGLCPLEDAVKKLDIPDKMVGAIRARIKKLMKK